LFIDSQIQRMKKYGQQTASPKGGLFRPIPEKKPSAQAVEPQQPTPPSPSTDDELLTDADVMTLLKVKKQWLRDHTTRVLPIVPHIKIGREIRYSKRAIHAWIMAQQETRPTWERKEKAA